MDPHSYGTNKPDKIQREKSLHHLCIVEGFRARQKEGNKIADSLLNFIAKSA
jgi:hypothetical protein